MLNFYNDIIELIIKDYGLKNQSEFCRMTGIKNSNVGQWKKGSMPSVEFLERIMSAFPDLSPDWLITATGEMKRKTAVEPEVVDSDCTLITYLKNEIKDLKKEKEEALLNIGKREQRIEDLESQLAVFLHSGNVAEKELKYPKPE
jgi:transcriptional regulator with XRE-family HTH domain